MNIQLATLEIYVFDEMPERLCNVLHFLLMVLGLGLQLHCWKQKPRKWDWRLRLEYDDVFVLILRTVWFVDFFIMFLKVVTCDLRVWFFYMMDGWDCVFGLKTIWPLEEFKMLEGDGTTLTPLSTRAWARALRLQHGKFKKIYIILRIIYYFDTWILPKVYFSFLNFKMFIFGPKKI